MGRKKLAPGEKKSNAQIKREQRERKKKEMGVEAFNAAEAARKRDSNASVWASLNDEQKDERRQNTRDRGQKFRDKAKGAQVDVEPHSDAKQETETKPEPVPDVQPVPVEPDTSPPPPPTAAEPLRVKLLVHPQKI